MLNIFLFGEPRVLVHGEPYKFHAPPKTLPLAAYLLIHRAQPVSRQRLACILWPEASDEGARANLRRHLHYLRSALPPARDNVPWVLSEKETIQWNLQAPFQLDVAEFEQACSQTTNLERLQHAVRLYQDDLLPNLYEDWVFYERERLQGLYFRALSQLVLQHRLHGRYGEATQYAQLLLRRDPLREDMLRQLVAVRYEAGDRAGALQIHEQFVQLLRLELGVEPMPETTSLYESILRGQRLPGSHAAPNAIQETPQDNSAPKEPALAAAPTDTGGSAMSARPPEVILPFVGRSEQMGWLQARWQAARRGQGHAVLVSGEAGIGKTRLVRELAVQIERQGGRVLWGSAQPNETSPYQTLAAALSSALPLLLALQVEPVWLAALAPLVPELRQRRALPSLPALDPERERQRLEQGLTRALQELAGPRPLLLVLEDLHWSGAASIHLLNTLIQAAASQRWLIVCTYRQEEIPRDHPLRDVRRRLQRAESLEVLSLPRLSAKHTSEMLATLLEESSPADKSSPGASLASRWHASADGNPLFLSLLLAQAIERREVEWTGERWRAQAAGDQAPSTLTEMIQRRIERLSAHASGLLETASILGSAFSIETLLEVCGWEEWQALDALEELLDRHLLQAAGGRSRYDYVFSHHLIQSTVYNAIPEARRKSRHHRAARVIEELNGSQAEALAGELGWHYAQGGDTRRAVPFLLRAAQHAAALYASGEAAKYVRQAMDMHPSAADQFALLEVQETIQRQAGECEAQQIALDAMQALAEGLGDAALCQVLRRQVALYHSQGDRAAEAEALELLRNHSACLEDPASQANVLEAEAIYAMGTSQFETARQHLQAALALQQQHNNRPGQVTICCLLAETLAHLGEFEPLQPLLGEAMRLAGDQSNYSQLVQTLRTAALASFSQQDFSAAASLAQQMLDLCRQIGDREGEADALARLAAIAARRFQIEPARQHYAQAEALYASLGKRQGQAAVLVNSAMFTISRLGRYTEGIASTRKAETIFLELGDRRGQWVCALNLGMASFYTGDYFTAKEAASRGLSLAQAMKSPLMQACALANLGAAERELGELQAAIEHMQAGLALRRGLGAGSQAAELGTDLCDLIVACLKAGRLDLASAAVEEMLALYHQFTREMMHPQYILWAAASTRQAQGCPEEAASLFTQARQVLEEKAAAIPDPESRESFLNLPFNRLIIP